MESVKKNGVFVQTVSREYVRKIGLEGSHGNNDDYIIASYTKKERNDNQKTLFISADRGARAIALSAGVEVLDFDIQTYKDLVEGSSFDSSDSFEEKMGKFLKENKQRTPNHPPPRRNYTTPPPKKKNHSPFGSIIGFIILAFIVGSFLSDDKPSNSNSSRYDSSVSQNQKHVKPTYHIGSQTLADGKITISFEPSLTDRYKSIYAFNLVVTNNSDTPVHGPYNTWIKAEREELKQAKNDNEIAAIRARLNKKMNNRVRVVFKDGSTLDLNSDRDKVFLEHSTDDIPIFLPRDFDVDLSKIDYFETAVEVGGNDEKITIKFPVSLE